ncbi:hypothetical protein DVH24_008061 [Malus domestica]|uniref:RNase H type-1 domain-containing protein n=1 Tax=Malus domestica TaxID=3750 RepID=A0A498JQN0_MALDO|nr:hypothetical protein DVH24_008061 [Malus domestica]
MGTIRCELPNDSPIGIIVEDSKALLSLITGAIVAHTRCQNNEVAHRLARHAVTSFVSCSWFEEPPDIISDVLFSYCNPRAWQPITFCTDFIIL